MGTHFTYDTTYKLRRQLSSFDKHANWIVPVLLKASQDALRPLECCHPPIFIKITASVSCELRRTDQTAVLNNHIQLNRLTKMLYLTLIYTDDPAHQTAVLNTHIQMIRLTKLLYILF